MELVSNTDEVVEVSSNGNLIRNPSTPLVVEGSSLETCEKLPEQNKMLSEEVSYECLLEVPAETLLEERPLESHSENLPNGSHLEDVPRCSLPGLNFSPELPGESFHEEVQTTISTEVSSTAVVEVTANWDLTHRTDNSSFKIPAAVVLLNGAEKSNASRDSENEPNIDVIKEEVIEEQTNGWKPEVYDTSILLPPWNQARVPGPAIAISDMRGVDSLNYSKVEKLLRCKLAASYRLIDMLGWSDGVNANISALTNSGDVLVTPLGILHHEVTSSSLVKVSIEGDIIDPGSTGLTVDTDDLTLHVAIYRSRPETRCIMRFSSPIVVSFSVLKCGLLPLCPEAMELGHITYTDYFGASCSEDDEVLRLVQHQNSKVIILRNFGIVVCGDSVEQSFDIAHNVLAAIETQFKILPVGLANFYMPSEEKQRSVLETTCESPPDVHPSRIGRRLEDVRFEGFMRMLDGAGYQTGYSYRFPLSSKRTARSQSLMEVTHSSKSSVSDTSRVHDESLPCSCEPSRSVTPSSRRPASVMNTKSLTENGQGCQITSHRFVPLGTDVREYKQKVKEIRKDFMPRNASAGPHSTVLEGVTWDEARSIQERQNNGGGGGIRVTAASRGIIQRDHQKSARFYNDFTAGNPFDAVSKKELDDYVHEVERKTANPVPPSTLPTVLELDVKLIKQESIKESRHKENLNVCEDKSKTATEPTALAEVKNGHQPKNESQNVPYQTINDKPTVQSPAFSEKQENVNERVSDQHDARPFHKFEEPIKPTVAVEHSPVIQEKTEPGKAEAYSSVQDKTSQQQGQTVPSSLAAAQVKQEEKLAQEVAHPKSQESSHEASKSGKFKKSHSMMESDTNKTGVSTRESGAEGVELRTKDKKKKRGLSAIFSKKKDT